MGMALRGTRPRIAAGFERLFSRPTVPYPPKRAPLERPLPIVGLFLALSIALMFWADLPLGLWMQDFPDELRPFARWITDLGEGVEILVTSGVVLILCIFVPSTRLRRRVVVGANSIAAAAAFIFLSVAGGGLTASLVKNMIGRARPSLLDTHGYLHFEPFTFDSDFAAFPSGHSATAGAMAMSLALVFPRLRSLFIPVGVLITLSRQLVGAHWPSDTMMGWAVGVAFTLWMGHVFARRRMMFFYDREGHLRRKEGRRVMQALWKAATGGVGVAKIT